MGIVVQVSVPASFLERPTVLAHVERDQGVGIHVAKVVGSSANGVGHTLQGDVSGSEQLGDNDLSSSMFDVFFQGWKSRICRTLRV